MGKTRRPVAAQISQPLQGMQYAVGSRQHKNGRQVDQFQRRMIPGKIDN